MDCDQKSKLSGLKKKLVTIHSNGKTIFSFTHIEGIPLGTGEGVDVVSRGASGMG